MPSISNLKKQIQDAQAQISELRESNLSLDQDIKNWGSSALKIVDNVRTKLFANIENRLATHTRQADTTYSDYPPYFSPDWKAQDWQDYQHNIHAPVNFITIGAIYFNCIVGTCTICNIELHTIHSQVYAR